MDSALDTKPSRQRLLEAGAELFLRHGFDAASLENVRQAAGVSNGSLYHHFPSKAHLARALYLDALADYQRFVSAAIDGSPSAAEGVAELVERHINWVTRRPQQARVLATLRAATRVDALPPDWHTVNAAAFDRLRAWIGVEVAAGRMLEMPLNIWLALVLAPAMKVMDEWLDQERARFSPDLRALLREAAVRAVTSRSARTGRRR